MDIRTFSNYRNVGDDRVNRPHVIPCSYDVKGLESEIERQIFAPDPATGKPRSDLAIVLNEHTRPEVEAYVKQRLMRPLPTSPRTDDIDLVLDSVKSSGESFEEYANRLRELCNSSDK